MSERRLTIVGPIVHSFTKEAVTLIEDGAVTVDNDEIISVSNDGVPEEFKKWPQRRLKKGQFLCPGFIDLHIHAPQYPNICLGMDKPLLEWLETYTIPLETKYTDTEFAESVYDHVTRTTVRCGTTTACYYATIHRQSTEILAKIVEKIGQRALIGKVNMNQNSSKDYVETTQESLKETEAFLLYVKTMNNPLIEAVITPRFAISCDVELLEGLGTLAAEYNSYIQTHISENREEVAYTMNLFPNCSTYSDIYDKARLLTDKTILGHGVYLTDKELALISQTGASIAHCPNSNTLLQSGQCDVRRLWDQGISVGLGTDVSGGCNPGLLDAMRSALSNSLHISFTNTKHKPLTYHEVFYMATLGAAKALGKDNLVGNFVKGKKFDALIVDMNVGHNSINCSLNYHSTSELFQKFIYSGDDRNIKCVYVNGKPIHFNEK